MPPSRLTALLGTTLRLQRELHGLTQHALAERADTSQSTIARIEQGDRAPTVSMLERLFAALDLQLTVGVEPLDAHLDARIDDLGRRSIAERVSDVDLDRTLDRLGDLPYVLTGATAALVQGAPVPMEDVEIAVAWRDVEQFATWLDRYYAQRWNPKWEEFGYLPTDPRKPGEHRWRTVGGVLRASMCDELPEAIEVRLGDRGYPVLPLALVEVTEPATADLLHRWRERHRAAENKTTAEQPEHEPGHEPAAEAEPSDSAG
ncbi:helix-turn-helix transcriptional regulator [Plantactinospora sp. S1510]|uniref:Helix-turn-helix transcriptional regulator n=1 Tax=Plantactinospora alkalitolerans TaxID=2789879 RepID=A0ABS0GPQ1_9ACTN|nr:helix-turn-helix transcriptional regulator [Plantactinospora alkalitolerans]MBF9128178.1 helix-turn-helix transcriptional regulator [Plantactinospora alkalitolerans]